MIAHLPHPHPTILQTQPQSQSWSGNFEALFATLTVFMTDLLDRSDEDAPAGPVMAMALTVVTVVVGLLVFLGVARGLGMGMKRGAGLRVLGL